MFGLTALELARIQFGFTMSSHIIFPAITIGLASYLAVLEGLWLWTKDVGYRDLYHFWSKIFAVNFAMGVVSGLVMAYQFGTNWSYFSASAGSIVGTLLTYEVLTAFFLEAGFLGVMLFGWNKVGPGLHFFATTMVAIGTLILCGWPDMTAETTRYAIEIPHLGSMVLTHSWNGQIRGLKDFPAENRPNSTVVFWTFRVMAGLGFLMLLLGLWGAWARWRRRLFESRLFLRFAVLMGPAGLIAILAGWLTTEIGRQPWVVYGVMRTRDAVSNHSALALTTSLVMFLVMYFAVFGTGISYMLKLVAKGPETGGREAAPGDAEAPNRRPARPLSAAPDAVDPAGALAPSPEE